MNDLEPCTFDPNEGQTPVLLNLVVGGTVGLALGVSGHESMMWDAGLTAGGMAVGALKNYVAPHVMHLREVSYYRLCEKLGIEPNRDHLK